MERILDAAEVLFAQHGLYGVTLKEVAAQVGVHHTLLNYYFEDKKTLFDAVFARRAVVTSERRMRVLDEYDASTKTRPSKGLCGRSSTPISISISRAAKGGRTTPS